ncbi:hypothetical protein M0812_15148 [Anaeramoeba flamelloides]|uniref:Uncharacterized protein n=1 Tax=Anaeramoeba flamelloides TaxID=1746091 RepID=A0AAV7ZAQ4_9EUKA|nr:hypothetical protein M0812_15148 [Anaeramoeba flamelloides]
MSRIIDIRIPSKQLIENTKEVFHVCYEPIFSQETEELQEILQDTNVQRDLKNITIHSLVNFYSLATISIVTPEIYIFVESRPSILIEKNSFLKNGKELRAHRMYYKFKIGNTKNLKGLTLDLSNYRYLIDTLNSKLLFNTLNPYDELSKPSEIQKIIEKGYGLVKGLFEGRRKRKLDEKEKVEETSYSSESGSESGSDSDKFLIDIINNEKSTDDEDESDELIEEQKKKKKRTFQIETRNKNEHEQEQEQIEQLQQLLSITNKSEKEKVSNQEKKVFRNADEENGRQPQRKTKKKAQKSKLQQFNIEFLDSKIPKNKSLKKKKKKKNKKIMKLPLEKI